MNDVLLYAQSRLTRKQAVREIGEIVLRANMKPRTVKQALQLIKAILPPDNTLPSTVQELFGAMLSCKTGRKSSFEFDFRLSLAENDWRLAQYLIRHKQQPSFSPSLWNSSSNSTTLAQLQPSMFLPVMSSSSSSSESESDNDHASATSDSDSSSNSDLDTEDDENDDDDVEEDEEEDENIDGNDFLTTLRRAHQQRPAAATASTLVQLSPPRVEIEPPPRPAVITGNSTALSTEQRSQIASNPLNRFAFLGSFKRQRSEVSRSARSSFIQRSSRVHPPMNRRFSTICNYPMEKVMMKTRSTR